MKTMKSRKGKIIRVPDSQVSQYLDKGYRYCSKSERKQKVRDKNVSKVNN
jgi:hypothetical protein